MQEARSRSLGFHYNIVHLSFDSLLSFANLDQEPESEMTPLMCYSGVSDIASLMTNFLFISDTEWDSRLIE